MGTGTSITRSLIHDLLKLEGGSMAPLSFPRDLCARCYLLSDTQVVVLRSYLRPGAP
jgi:hypothetical protein